MPVQDPRGALDPLVGRILGRLLDDAPLLFHVKDEQGRYVMATRSWAEILGRDREMLAGRTDAELVRPELAALLRRHETDVPRSPRYGDVEEELPSATGTRTLAARRFLIEDGGRTYLAMVAADITAEMALRASLKAAVVAKARLLASACHDMRQPLQAAGLFLDVLRRRTAKDKRAAEAADAAIRSLQAIERIVAELLTLSQIEATAERPQRGPVELAGLMAELSAEFAPRAEAKGLRLRTVPTSLTVASDPHLLARILRNLLSNAIAYTERGGVLLGCRRRPGAAEIQVVDTGPGIPEADREAIFKEFRRLRDGSSGETTGFGLGLAIVARLAELLDHRIDLRSTPGAGSAFSITAPLLTPEQPGSPVSAGGRSTVLVVGNADGMRAHAVSAVARLGLEAVEAGSLRELNDLLTRMREPPLLVLAEPLLASGSFGTEAVAHARARFGQTLPAVLVADRISPALQATARTARCRVARLPFSAPELNRLIATGAAD
jgi:PAS domain S-box-containing protein